MRDNEIFFEELGYDNISVGLSFLLLISDDYFINEKYKKGMSEKEIKEDLINIMRKCISNYKEPDEIKKEYIKIIDILINNRMSDWRTGCH
ncbi:hypothetical protein H2Y54_10285 [Pectobacterium aroidearum]|uniref:hypothetical protein n=1 Tax=Pectobacterium aroidearum TaxID=1201031 RepID=UPI0015F03EBF|nr:hypothetical protein [Pectobacterium aroidearum]MBA5236932.1 hypothetical protein [Pectobacterium aroidearum]